MFDGCVAYVHDVFIKYHTGPVSNFFGTEVAFEFSARDRRSRVENSKCDRGLKEIFRPKCGIYFTIWSCRVSRHRNIMQHGFLSGLFGF